MVFSSPDINSPTRIKSTMSYENIGALQNIARTTVSDYYIKKSEIKFKNTIYKTEYVNIYEGEWRYERICVKEIAVNGEINNELFVLSKCIHPKIVQFLGFTKQSDTVSIVFEYMDNGNLVEYMKKNKLTKEQKINIMIEITIAINYLHNRNPETIIHRDIKPTNILVNKYGNIKLSDFGISKIIQKVDASCDNSNEKGTYIWMAPEVVMGINYNHTADIYSLGLLMYFIWTEKLPFEELNLITVQLMFMKIKNELCIALIEDNVELNNLIHACTSYDKYERPNSSEIINLLYNMQDKNQSF